MDKSFITKQLVQLQTVLSEGRGNMAEQAMTSSSAIDLAELLINFAREMRSSHLFSPQRLKKVLQKLFKESDDVKQQQVKITIKLLTALWNELSNPETPEA
jgi:hypothetical protein